MAAKSETRVIGDSTYRVNQLAALKARAVFMKLVNKVGPTFAALLGTGVTSAILSIDVSKLAPMLTEFCSSMTDEDLDYFCVTLGETSFVVGANGNEAKLTRSFQDIHFAGRLLDMFKWLAFALEVNFADFLYVLKAIPAAKLGAPVSVVSPSPTDSIGTVGVS